MLEDSMKIVLPVENNDSVDSKVYGHFGSAPYFAIYDTVSQMVTIIDNTGKNHEHGSCMPVAELQGIDAGAVLCKGMGMRAANNLIAAGIKPFIVDANTVAEAITEYKSGNITELNAGNACQSHGCH
jgi:predicted Fe-Mo cluster-binding NifX family protein